jgi:hypothetical protein
MFADFTGAIADDLYDDFEQPNAKSGSSGPPMLDLARLASITVPAHGLVVNRGMSSAGKVGGTFLPWLRRLFGAVAIASMIALGLFVYTEFTASWQQRGLPSIPISALAALEAPLQTQANPQVSARGTPQRGGATRQQTFNALNDYVG